MVGLHDSIDVATLEFAGAQAVSPDDLKRVVFTRTSSCRLPFLVPLCKLTPTQLFPDRRRTTPAALGEDITKLRVYYWQRGFREAQVDTVLVPAKRGMAVAFRIVEGEPTRVGALDVSQRTPVLTPKELEDAVVLRTGAPLDLVALDSTLARLRAAVWNKGYGDVRIDTAVPRPDASNVVPVNIDVDPRLDHARGTRRVRRQPRDVATRRCGAACCCGPARSTRATRCSRASAGSSSRRASRAPWW